MADQRDVKSRRRRWTSAEWCQVCLALADVVVAIFATVGQHR